jgi:hypothetical protein
LDSEYLNFLKTKLKEEFEVNSYLYFSKKRNVSFLVISNRLFIDLVLSFGFPIGKKLGKLILGNNILGLKWQDKKKIIRGLFAILMEVSVLKRDNFISLLRFL